MRITVVTVCRNAENEIKRTIVSILNQNFNDYEYIIVDGKSEDNTMSIINSFLPNGRVTVISEEDDGIYDAMNKGIKKARGEYIIFMNAGDVFYDANVLVDIEDYLDKDVVYGDVIRVKTEGDITEKYKGPFIEMRLFLAGRMMCHQSMFVRTSLMKDYPFDTNYRITADYNLAVKLYSLGKSFKHVDRVICRFDSMNGVSSQSENNDFMRAEDDMTLKSFFPCWFVLLYIPKFLVRSVKRAKERSDR